MRVRRTKTLCKVNLKTIGLFKKIKKTIIVLFITTLLLLLIYLTYDMSIVFISICVGILTSLISILFWEWLKLPNLKILIPERVKGIEPFVTQEFENINLKRAFYHLQVINIGETTAPICRIKLTFIDIKTKKKLKPLNGKWARTPEPLIYINGVYGLVQPSMKTFSETLDIYPNVPESFAVVVKYFGDKECYGYGSDSYFAGNELKSDDWKIALGKLIVEITYLGKRKLTEFLLDNSGKRFEDISISEFKYITNKI